MYRRRFAARVLAVCLPVLVAIQGPLALVEPQSDIDSGLAAAKEARAAARAKSVRSDLDEAIKAITAANVAEANKDAESAAAAERLAKRMLDAAKAGAAKESDKCVNAIGAAQINVANALATSLKTPVGFDVYVPSLALEGDTLTGVVVARLPEGKVDPQPIVDGEVIVGGEPKTIGPGGIVALPVGPGVISFSMNRMSAGKPFEPQVGTINQVPKSFDSAKSTIVHTSPVLGTSGVFRVVGANLAGLTDARLEYADGRMVAVSDESAGSSLERIYMLARAPLGTFRFTARAANGDRVSSPNTTNRASIKLDGPARVKKGSNGEIAVTATGPGYVSVFGGPPQITVGRRTQYLDSAGIAKLSFKATQSGPYVVSATIEDAPPELSGAGSIATSAPMIVCTPAGAGTRIEASTIASSGERGGPISGALVDIAILYPGGIQYARVPTNENGRAAYTANVPVSVEANQVRVYVLSAAAAGFNWSPSERTGLAARSMGHDQGE